MVSDSFFCFINSFKFEALKVAYFSANQNAYKFRIVEMKDQKDSFRNDTFDGK